MTPTIESEFRRKRRMMKFIWNTLLTTSILDPRGYSPAYALEIYSHRLLRYATPFLHAAAFGGCVASLRSGAIYRLALAVHGAFGAAVAGRKARSATPLPARPLLRGRHRVERTRPVGLAAPRDLGHVGEPGGNPLAGDECEHRVRYQVPSVSPRRRRRRRPHRCGAEPSCGGCRAAGRARRPGIP